MKYISLLFIMIILAACLSPSTDDSLLPLGEGQGMRETSTPPPTPDTSHLTPDTSHLTPDTPIPTPTIHPQVIALQEQIAAGGEAFTLNPDGQIEMWTVEEGMTIVPDIQVHPDGAMTFTHEGQEFQADPETLSIEGQTISFKDENGKTWVFDGENWEDRTAEVQLAEDMKIFNLSLDDYKITYDAEGKIELRNKSNKLVYWDGKWNSKEIANIIRRAEICKPTEFVVSSQMPPEWNEYTWSIFHTVRKTDRFKTVNTRPLYDELGYFNYDPIPSPLRDSDNCWIVFVLPINPKQPINYVAFETADSQIIGVPLFTP